MSKLVPIFALLLGLAIGFLWPINQNHQPEATPEIIINSPPLVEVLAGRQEAMAATEDQPETKEVEPEAPAATTKTNPEPAPKQPDPTPPQAEATTPKADPEPTPPVATTAPKADPKPTPKPPDPTPPQAEPKPKLRVVRGQTPEAVIKAFRRESPPKLITRKQTPQPASKPAAKAPKTQPSTSPSPTNSEAKPVDGNYCYLAYGYQGWSVEIAFAVCMGESGGYPRAVNLKDRHGSCNGSYGLFQIACLHADPDDMLDPAKNIKKAIELYQRRGWQPWGAYTNGSYRRYLTST